MGNPTTRGYVVLIIATAIAVEVVRELLPRVVLFMSAAIAASPHIAGIITTAIVAEGAREVLHYLRQRKGS